MSFLQPLMLLALPVIALPILIHLMNQRRFHTMEWGAMIFLLAANRMSRGFARIRRWLILAARTLVVAGLIFAIARPLASGWLGLAAGNRTDTTIVLLDRSPSMSAMDPDNVASKLATGRKQLAAALEKLHSNHWILIDSATGQANTMESAADLLSAAEAEPTSCSADLPTMLEAAHEYVQSNKTGRTDIWICSDLRRHDWDASGGRWNALREGFLKLPQSIRFYLLAFPELPRNNRSVRVTLVERNETDDGGELVIGLEIKRSGKQSTESVPIEFNIDGARSVLNVELSGPTFQLVGHRIRLNRDQVQGWGRVSIPADSVEPDNEFFFVFDRQPTRRTLIVTEQPQAAHAFRLAAEIPSDSTAQNSVELISARQLDSVAWDEIGLVVWDGNFPKTADTLILQSFVDAGGRLFFLPPQSPSGRSCFGMQWDTWQSTPEDLTVGSWRGDSDLLANTLSGMALPVGELGIKRTCGIGGNVVPLASLSDGRPLLVRAPTDRGAVYALTTTAASQDSSLAKDGVVLYVMIQRALSEGSARLANVRQVVSGAGKHDSLLWQRLAGADRALSHQLHFHSGVFQTESRLLAFNRDASEDSDLVLSGEQVDALFTGLPFVRVTDRAGAASSLIREIWRLFLILMLAAMVAEAALCLPRRPAAEGALA